MKQYSIKHVVHVETMVKVVIDDITVDEQGEVTYNGGVVEGWKNRGYKVVGNRLVRDAAVDIQLINNKTIRLYFDSKQKMEQYVKDNFFKHDFRTYE